jgi:hypothetical protein
MNVSDTSTKSYKKLAKSGGIEDRKARLMEFFREMGGEGTAFDMIRHIQSSVNFADDEARFRFVQNVHATVSDLAKEGVLKCTGVRVNPPTGAEVKFYEINEGDVVPVETVEKGYKKRFEALQVELVALTKRLATAESELSVYKNDSIKKDCLADVYYEARSKVDWNMILNLFAKQT